MGGDAAAHHLLLQPRQPLNSPPAGPYTHRHTGGRRRNFPLGSVVEVQTNEEDFKGVYFSATVIPPLNSPKKSGRKKSKRLYVEYHNLLAHEDGLDHLREYVNPAFVRPLPPLLELGKGFEVDDIVDAFYKDGWWTGVVSRPVDGGERFVVTFNNPPDELVFALSELRAHWDWVNGSWVRPQRQSISGLMFDVGRKVEVSFEREDCQDAWFLTTIQEDLGNGTFMVDNITADTDNDGLATKVKVDSLHIRPCPPLLKDKNFVLLEKVDAFFDLGWWSGIITKQLENSRYLVFFKQMKCDMEFDQSELRPHMEWKDGKWFTSSQEPPSIPFSDEGVCQHPTPENSSASVATAPVNNSIDGEDTCGGKTHPSLISRKGHFELFIPDNLKLAHVTTSLSKKRAYLSDSGSAIFQPLKKLKEGNLAGANKKDKNDGSEKKVLCGFVSPESLNHMEKSVVQTTLDQSSSNRPWEEKVQRKQRNSRTPQNVSGRINSTFSSLGKSSAQILPPESLELDIGEKEPGTAGNTEKVAQNEHEKRETVLPIVIGLPCAESGSSEFGMSGGNKSQLSNKKMDDQRQKVNNSTCPKVKDAKQLGSGEVSEKRKRGRPRKNLVESTETPLTGNVEHRGISSGDLNKKDYDPQRNHELEVIEMEASISDQEKMTANQEKMTANQEKIANAQPGSGKKKFRMTKRMLACMYAEDGVAESVKLKKGRRQISSGKISIKVRDFLGASGGKATVVNRPMEAEKVIELPSNKFENEPLSKWIEEMHMSSVIDGSKLLSVDTVLKCIVNGDNQGIGVVLDEASEKQPESVRQSSGSIDKGDIPPTEPQSLPSVNKTVCVVLDEATRKQSESGMQTAPLVDKVYTVASEPHSLPSVNNTVDLVLDEATRKQSESGKQTASLVDKFSIVASEPQSVPSVEEMTTVVLLDQDIEKQPENEAQATAMVDKSSNIPSQPRSCVEKTIGVVLDEDNEKRPENGTAPAPALVNKLVIVPNEPENLPFVKNTILWKTIESMEVFKRMPQRPHFRPLENFKESSREGLAIGYMVTFSSLVERSSRLQLDDPISIMDDIKETLVDLEKHGFDVRVVEDCINELLAMKVIEEKLVNDTSTLDTQITEHNRKKTRIERDIEEINGHITKLQEKLSQATSAKEKEDEEIAFLQARLRETKESIKNVMSDFKGIVSSIL